MYVYVGGDLFPGTRPPAVGGIYSDPFRYFLDHFIDESDIRYIQRYTLYALLFTLHLHLNQTLKSSIATRFTE